MGIRVQGLIGSSGGLEFRVQGLGCRATFTERTADHFEANIMAQVETPHPVIVTIMDNKDYIRVLLYSYYTTITGWGSS